MEESSVLQRLVKVRIVVKAHIATGLALNVFNVVSRYFGKFWHCDCFKLNIAVQLLQNSKLQK